jgi:hypothetical protein
MKIADIFLLFIVISIVASTQINHLECGESPTHKYKELAKAIGKIYKNNEVHLKKNIRANIFLFH